MKGVLGEKHSLSPKEGHRPEILFHTHLASAYSTCATARVWSRAGFLFHLLSFFSSVVLFPICCVFNHLRKFLICIRELLKPSPVGHFLGGSRGE